MVLTLRYAYAKNNSNNNTVCNKDVVLPLQLRCSIILRLVRQRQKCRKLECAALFRAAVSTTLLFLCLRYFQNTKRYVYKQYIVFFRLTCTLQQHKLVSAKMFSMFSAKTSDVFTFYLLWGHGKSFAKSDQTGQTETDLQKCDLNRIPNHIRM